MMTATEILERDQVSDAELERIVRRCFELTDRALLGIVDRLEEVLFDHRTEIDVIGSKIIISLPRKARIVTVEIDTQRPIFRHVIARIATLMHQRRPAPEGFQPYGGGGYLPSQTLDGRGAYIIYGNSQQTGVWLKSTPA